MNNNSLTNENMQIGEQIQKWILIDNKLKNKNPPLVRTEGLIIKSQIKISL